MTLLLLAAAACHSSGRSAPPPTTVSTPPSTAADAGLPLQDFAGAPPCDPASPIIGAEVQGTAPGGSLYGLLFLTEGPPIVAGQEVKIVWRMTGSGDLQASARSGGAEAELTFGPERHSGSNYSRPGDEWGTGWIFPTPGCWDVHLTRSGLEGHVWLEIQPAA